MPQRWSAPTDPEPIYHPWKKIGNQLYIRLKSTNPYGFTIQTCKALLGDGAIDQQTYPISYLQYTPINHSGSIQACGMKTRDRNGNERFSITIRYRL